MEKEIKDIRYFLMLVPENGTNEPMSREEDARVWGVFRGLPEKIQAVITARELPFLIEKMAQAFQLNEDSIGKISVLIRKIFFGEMDLARMESQLASLFLQTGQGDPNKARDIVQFIDREILRLVPKPVIEESEDEREEKKGGMVQMTLLQAMGKYPRLGDQNITGNRIRLRSQPDPVRGSLSSWIRYYRDELGIGFHDEIQRGRFLFQSDNGKKLSTEEREHLNLILKSIEEEFPLNIDTEHQVILFPALQKEALSDPRGVASRAPEMPFSPSRATPSFVGGASRSVSPAPMMAQRAEAPSGRPIFNEFSGTPTKNVAGETLHFSTGHVLPAEKVGKPAPAEGAAALNPNLPNTIRRAPAASSAPVRNPYSIRPLRLRSDREE